MLHVSSSEDESDQQRPLQASDRRVQQAQEVEIHKLQMMVTQSRAVVEHPYNKMHGRGPDMWQSDDDDRPACAVRIHTSDQLPRRRQKKNPDRHQREERDGTVEEAAIDRAWQEMMRTTTNVHGVSSSMSTLRQSGSSSAAADATSSGIRRPSGSQNVAPGVAPNCMTSRSGLQPGTAGASSQRMTSRSGSESIAAGVSPHGMTSPSGLHITRDTDPWPRKAPRPMLVQVTTRIYVAHKARNEVFLQGPFFQSVVTRWMSLGDPAHRCCARSRSTPHPAPSKFPQRWAEQVAEQHLQRDQS
eukprot:s3224_g7.t1